MKFDIWEHLIGISRFYLFLKVQRFKIRFTQKRLYRLSLNFPHIVFQIIKIIDPVSNVPQLVFPEKSKNCEYVIFVTPDSICAVSIPFISISILRRKGVNMRNNRKLLYKN